MTIWDLGENWVTIMSCERKATQSNSLNFAIDVDAKVETTYVRTNTIATKSNGKLCFVYQCDSVNIANSVIFSAIYFLRSANSGKVDIMGMCRFIFNKNGKRTPVRTIVPP